jgi:hypothetical protein
VSASESRADRLLDLAVVEPDAGGNVVELIECVEGVGLRGPAGAHVITDTGGTPVQNCVSLALDCGRHPAEQACW